MMTFGKVVRRWKMSFSMIVAHVPVMAPERGLLFGISPAIAAPDNRWPVPKLGSVLGAAALLVDYTHKLH